MAEPTRQRLIETIKKLRNRVQQIRDRKEVVGEQNTKAALIDPLLSGLGWDLEDIEEVSREYKRKPQDNPVDYAIFMHRSPRLFVEAKGLGMNLSDRKWISQTLSYATVVGVEWCVLTNGDEYRLYNSHATVDVEEKLFRSVRISDSTNDEHLTNTLELLSRDKMGENLIDVLWKSHFIDRHVKMALDNLFQNEDAGLIRLIRKKKSGLRPSEVRESLKRADIRIDFPLITAPHEQPPVLIAAKSVSSNEASTTKKRALKFIGVEVNDLIQAGLIKPPLSLEKQYKGTRLRATIQQDGKVTFENRVYDSLSTAAGMARKTVIGAPPDREYPQTNGWTFWQFHNSETGKLEGIDVLRQQYLESQ